MQDNFQRSLSLVLKSEGGFVDNAHDPGGATNYGITQRVYDAFQRAHGAMLLSVRLIVADTVSRIYRAQYWDAIQGDKLPVPFDYLSFDEAVNSGPVQSIKDLQVCLGVAVDGHLGMVTLGALAGVSDRAGLVRKVCARRMSFLRRLKNWIYFGKGWTNRVNAVQANALAMMGTSA